MVFYIARKTEQEAASVALKQGGLNSCKTRYILGAMDEHELPSQNPDLIQSQHQALLEISQAIASHRDLGQLFHDLAPRLHLVVQFDFVNLILHERPAM